MPDREIEVRFLEIDVPALTRRLTELGAKNLGEDLLEEIIFYDKDLRWQKETGQFVRLRKSKGRIVLAYKDHQSAAVDGTEEIECGVESMQKMANILERVGLTAYRYQQKKRHSFRMEDVEIDIDTWPRIPTYVELEGPSEQRLRDTALKVGLDWNKAVFENARLIIENVYHIPVGSMRWFTFERFE